MPSTHYLLQKQDLARLKREIQNAMRKRIQQIEEKWINSKRLRLKAQSNWNVQAPMQASMYYSQGQPYINQYMQMGGPMFWQNYANTVLKKADNSRVYAEGQNKQLKDTLGETVGLMGELNQQMRDTKQLQDELAQQKGTCQTLDKSGGLLHFQQNLKNQEQSTNKKKNQNSQQTEASQQKSEYRKKLEQLRLQKLGRQQQVQQTNQQHGTLQQQQLVDKQQNKQNQVPPIEKKEEQVNKQQQINGGSQLNDLLKILVNPESNMASNLSDMIQNNLDSYEKQVDQMLQENNGKANENKQKKKEEQQEEQMTFLQTVNATKKNEKKINIPNIQNNKIQDGPISREKMIQIINS